MKYKYSICHPDNPKIEYSEKLSADEVRQIALTYPLEIELRKFKF